jgi:hypothetical protein
MRPVVVDVLTPCDTAPHTYDAIFHLDADAIELAPATARVVTHNRTGANFAIIPAMQPGLTVSNHQGEETPRVQGWVSRAGMSSLSAVPTPIWNLKATGEAQMIFVLYPSPEGRAFPVTDVTVASKTPGNPLALDVNFGPAGRDRITLSLVKPSNIGTEMTAVAPPPVSVNGH